MMPCRRTRIDAAVATLVAPVPDPSVVPVFLCLTG
jgi:hypothetical protein